MRQPGILFRLYALKIAQQALHVSNRLLRQLKVRLYLYQSGGQFRACPVRLIHLIFLCAGAVH